MQDWALPNLLHTVGQHLNQTFVEQCTKHRGPGNWPAQSPDLKNADIWMWRHPKTAQINDLRGTEAVSSECLSEESTETMNFQQSECLCVMNS